jgi:hypothetical protein
MLDIRTTDFDFLMYGSEPLSSNFVDDYMYHNCAAWNSIFVNEIELHAGYQTGQSVEHMDMFCPINDLELSEFENTHEALFIVNQFYDEDFEKEPTEYLLEQFEELKELLPCVETLEDMHQLYKVLMDNEPKLWSFLDSDIYTDELKDYEAINERYYKPKKASKNSVFIEYD